MAAPTEPTRSDSWPPVRYALTDVEISVRQQSGFKGEATEVKVRGTSSDPGLVELINEFYRIRFFDLPRDMTVLRSVVAVQDGVLVGRTLRLADTGSTTVCFAVGSWKSCVIYSTTGPVELLDLVKLIVRHK